MPFDKVIIIMAVIAFRAIIGFIVLALLAGTIYLSKFLALPFGLSLVIGISIIRRINSAIKA